MGDLRSDLQTHLGDAFRIERELGGGGMSRVFMATEVRLNRQVAIKVLSPELAQGLNAERFEREILLAASLQQANIVGVLSAGEVEGLPYFTMPFVDGESLRNRLTGTGLPIDDVVTILRDVSKALAYAHARGIVHRDIKPDNVLLSGGTAMVTDFGIAKALSASRMSDGAGTLTSIGTSIGTPAYMAPEQVAGDPNIDHRVDLYSLGCMAFELLTGDSPFGGRTPQKRLTAHLSEKPAAVSSLRSDSPAALSNLIAQLLEKDPVDRPRDASDVLQRLSAVGMVSSPTLSLDAPGMLPKVLGIYALATGAVAILAKAAIVGIGLPDWVFSGAVGMMLLGLPALLFTAYSKWEARRSALATPKITPGGTMHAKAPSGRMATMAMKASPHLSWRRAARGGMYAMGAFVVVVTGYMAMRSAGIGAAGSLFAKGQLAADDRIVLAGFTVDQGDSALAPILDAAVRAAMSQSKSVRMVDQADVGQMLQQMQRPRAASLDSALAREVATRAGAKAVLGGRLARVGPGYAVSLELVSADRGATLVSIQGTANGPADLLTVVDKLTRNLRGKIGESLRQVQHSIPLQQATTASLEALRKYSEASVAYDVDGDYDRAVTLARAAVALDSTFALAWRKLAMALLAGGGSAAAADSALRQAFRYADRLPDREKSLVIGAYYTLSREAADRGKALAAYQAAYAADSTSVIAASQLATSFTTRGEMDSALRYARRHVALSATLPSAGRLAVMLIRYGHRDEGAALLDSLRAANPRSEFSPTLLGARLVDLVAREEFDSVSQLVDQLVSSPQLPLRLFGLGLLGNRELQAGRLSRAAAAYKSQDDLLAGRGAIGQFDGLTEALLDAFVRADGGVAIRSLDALVAGTQWAAAKPVDRPYLSVAQAYAVVGDADRAKVILARFEAESPTAKAPASGRGRITTQGEIALAEKRYDEAIRLFHASAVAEDGAPSGNEAELEFALTRAFDAAGMSDSAIVHASAYLALPALERQGMDYFALADVHKRLGELYDAKGDRANAIKYYDAFVEQWKDADPELQPTVTTVKKRIAELRQQGG